AAARPSRLLPAAASSPAAALSHPHRPPATSHPSFSASSPWPPCARAEERLGRTRGAEQQPAAPRPCRVVAQMRPLPALYAPVGLDPTLAGGARVEERGLDPESAGGGEQQPARLVASDPPSLLVAPPPGWTMDLIVPSESHTNSSNQELQ
uniref:Uncharacterized protein n=4 Tax=Aegilops tauschii subsp. strangulata TaxID=200361 RepID=A0A453CEE0_AEGTS